MWLIDANGSFSVTQNVHVIMNQTLFPFILPTHNKIPRSMLLIICNVFETLTFLLADNVIRPNSCIRAPVDVLRKAPVISLAVLCCTFSKLRESVYAISR